MMFLTLAGTPEIDTPEKPENKDKFSVLYEKYRYLMWKVAMDVLHDRFLAEDAVHNAFLNLGGHMESIRETESLQTKRYLITIAKNAGRASMADEAAEPPMGLKFFYKEDVDNVAKMEMWINGCRYGKDIPFYITPDRLKGQLFQADDIMEEYEEQIGDVKGYSDFMNQISLFTGWYAWSTGINNRFGNYVPESL